MLKISRTNKKITQSQLSKMTNISQSYISKLERECFCHSPTVSLIIELTKALEVDVLELTKYFIEKEILKT
ncbi:XRE family transcriptional regulator [Clostridioides difficile]|nr:XRE family transcriptional regulator [Clostridioides difficile]EJA6616441.1 helix-turn-helix transcriptional regulator [Clostridioides difficile]MBH7252578.1 helix-turn-helix transcriptional regulator [Clostridioides difficile]MBY2530882.1 helix-turn-helix domain-containing protein [Clostridioides difficile]HBE9457346.1 helix-turn-helix transcriptional regulator [Clostridioides difficile]